MKTSVLQQLAGRSSLGSGGASISSILYQAASSAASVLVLWAPAPSARRPIRDRWSDGAPVPSGTSQGAGVGSHPSRYYQDIAVGDDPTNQWTRAMQDGVLSLSYGRTWPVPGTRPGWAQPP